MRSGIPLFIAGLLAIPCIVLQRQLAPLAAQMLFSFAWAVASGKKIKILYFLLLIASVSFFHLLTPNGQVHFYIWRLPITSGALLLGVRKGMVVTTLVFSSLATVRSGIRLPSRMGALLSTIFVYFDTLFQYRRALRRKTLLGDIDRLLRQLVAMPLSADGQRRSDFSRRLWWREVAIATAFLTAHATALTVGLGL